MQLVLLVGFGYERLGYRDTQAGATILRSSNSFLMVRVLMSIDHNQEDADKPKNITNTSVPSSRPCHSKVLHLAQLGVRPILHRRHWG